MRNCNKVLIIKSEHKCAWEKEVKIEKRTREVEKDQKSLTLYVQIRRISGSSLNSPQLQSYGIQSIRKFPEFLDSKRPPLGQQTSAVKSSVSQFYSVHIFKCYSL